MMQRKAWMRIVLALVVLGSLALNVSPTWAVGDGEAVLGQPFGVARLSIPVAATRASSGFEIHDADARVLYPAFRGGPLGQLVTGLLGGDPETTPNRLNISFLFTGTAPLEVTVYTPEAQHFVLKPTARPRRIYERSMQRWWRDYHAVARQQEQLGDYPPLVHTYLTTMLSQRLELRPPLLGRVQESRPSELQETMQLVFGAEKLRRAILRDTIMGKGLGEVADRRLPPAIAWKPLELAEPPDDVEIEPIAFHVPHECFYIRFGNFKNYLWLSNLLNTHGGDIGQMVKLRGHNAALNKKLEKQLALKQSALAEILGPQVIADVAIIGRDMYLKEGAAMAMLFQARNKLALSADFAQQRAAALAAQRENGATMETISIAGHDVSFLSTPDNRLRSFYAVDGEFHLVSTTRAIVQRFFEAGQGRGALGATAEFQHARHDMPLTRDDTILAYHSSAFFAHLLSPRYQFELTRRLQAVADTELLQLARLAAAAEGVAGDSLDELIVNGFLPRGFGVRADGSGPVVSGSRTGNSQRGARGYFTPIPDMPMKSVTAGELAAYADRAKYYQQHWTEMDPLVSAVKRYALNEKGLERVVIDANVSPLVEEKYGWLLSVLGPPTNVEIASNPDDIITMQASVRGGFLDPGIVPHHLFLGVRDAELNIQPQQSGFFQSLQLMQSTPGYLGAWPKMGFLDLLPVLSGEADAAGFSPLLLGAWRWQGGDFSVISFDRLLLEDTSRFLQPVESDHRAQVRIRIGDLAHSRLAAGLTALNYQRATQTSLGNTRLLQAMSQQFHLPKEVALSEAEMLLDTKLVCTLGGRYELANQAGRTVWQSTAIAEAGGAMPDDYQAPLLDWFRGAKVDLTKRADRLDLHAEIDMQRKKVEPGFKLPSFNLFGGDKKE
jgi:hypothetical protein